MLELPKIRIRWREGFHGGTTEWADILRAGTGSEVASLKWTFPQGEAEGFTVTIHAYLDGEPIVAHFEDASDAYDFVQGFLFMEDA
jgi:hypothetical protein